MHALRTMMHEQPMLMVGFLTLCSFFLGRLVTRIRLPSIIGFMTAGVLLGTSATAFLDHELQQSLGFITHLALGFVAMSIGLELDLRSLRRLGGGIAWAILAESFGAFLVVLAAVYLVSGSLPLALVFAGIAPASAPAGTVAVIKEFRARGSLTKALYAVVGFDDGLGIVIFGFAAAAARCLLEREAGAATQGLANAMLTPLREVFLSLLVGGVGMLLLRLMLRWAKGSGTWILTFGTVLILVGLSEAWHLSLILTNMVLGMALANAGARDIVENLKRDLSDAMPLLFVLFFALAGAHLEIGLLWSMGLVGGTYVLARSAGLVGGAWAGGSLGRLEPKIRKYLGLGILSQAGVAIGLALVVAGDFGELGPGGEQIGKQVLTTITATCILFELVGPILTKFALERAGEIDPKHHRS